MPHATNYNYLTVKELHPTFGAEVCGINVAEPLSPETFEELRSVLTKV
jgi:alpha-ketoglutarate-dependent taurine dioxygenase